jgi:hypothetical protein
MKSGYRESEKDKDARKRERQIARTNAATAASEEAADLTSDLRAIYGLRGMTGTRTGGSTPRQPGATSVLGLPGNTPDAAGIPRNLWDMLMAGAPK